MGTFSYIKKLLVGLLEILVIIFRDFVIISFIAFFIYLFHNYPAVWFDLTGDGELSKILENSHIAMLLTLYIVFSVWDIYKYIKRL